MEKRYQKIKERYQFVKEKSIINNYYSKEINKGKSYKAVYFDKIAIVLLVFMISTAAFSSLTNTIILPVFLSLIIVYFITKYFVVLRNKKQNKSKQKVNDDLKSKRIQRELSQLNREEFINYIKGILEKYYQSEFTFGEDGIDLIGNVQNKSYAVKCIKSNLEDKIIRKKVLDFHSYINYLNFDEGIIVTNSYFQEGVKDDTSLILIDFLGIKEILININEYPSDEEIANYIKHRYYDKSKVMKSQIMIISIKKIIKLYGIFIVFYVISFFVKYSLYYKIMALLSFVIATILGGMKITEYVKLKSNIPLQK